MSRSRTLLLVLALLLGASQGSAQSVRLSPFVAPLTHRDGIGLNRAEGLGHRNVSASLLLDYANDPLVIEARSGESDTETAHLVRHHANAQLRLSYGLFERLVLSAGLDVVLAMTGDRFVDPRTRRVLGSADGPGLADGLLAARYVAVGDERSLIGLAVQGQLTLPLAEVTASSQNWSGEETVSFRPAVLLAVRPGPVRIDASLGAIVRKDGELLGTRLGDALSYGLGVASTLPGRMRLLELLGELHGTTGLRDFFVRESSPLALLFGARLSLRDHWRLSAAAGPGLTRGVGSPDYRVLATLAFTTAGSDVSGKSSGDCPRGMASDGSGECVEVDGDADGVPDVRDHCPMQPEDRDMLQDYDGCPEIDNDLDGLQDSVDQCPLEPEDHDDFEDHDGCPD